MHSILPFFALIAIIGVGVVLLMGLVNMMRGGPGNRSQKLMQARVMLQAIAILGALLYSRR